MERQQVCELNIITVKQTLHWFCSCSLGENTDEILTSMISGLEDILKGSGPENVGSTAAVAGEAAVAATVADSGGGGGGKAEVGKSDAAGADAREDATTSGLHASCLALLASYYSP